MQRLPRLPVRPPSPPTRLPFRLRTLGRVRGEPYHVTAGTYHNDAMLTLIRAGSGLYHRRGKAGPVGRGMLGLVLPGAEPGLLMAEPSDPYDHYYCRFAGSEALRMARQISARHGGAAFFDWPRWPEASAILELMLSLHDDAPLRAPEWMTEAEAELARLLALLLAPGAEPRLRLDEASLRRYLTLHIARPLDLGKMARHFRVSRFHLSRTARQLLGEKLSLASTRLKLSLARSLLTAQGLELSVTQIAQRVGYEDPLYFSRVFRRYVGMSPSEARRRESLSR